METFFILFFILFYFILFFIFQIALGTIFLFPIRLIIVLILFLLNSLLAKIFLILLDKWDLNPEQHFKWRFVWFLNFRWLKVFVLFSDQDSWNRVLHWWERYFLCVDFIELNALMKVSWFTFTFYAFSLSSFSHFIFWNFIFCVFKSLFNFHFSVSLELQPFYFIFSDVNNFLFFRWPKQGTIKKTFDLSSCTAYCTIWFFVWDCVRLTFASC